MGLETVSSDPRRGGQGGVPIGQTLPFTAVRWDDILFIVLAISLLGSALLVVTMRDIIRCGLAMIASFASLAGIYVLLGNPLIAATQVLVYIGAISILVLFAIMLTQTKNAPNRLVFQTQAWAGAIAAVAIAVIITATVLATSWPSTGAVAWTATSAIATMLFGEYVLPFEVVSVLLTAAVVGGVLLARREAEPGREDRS
jgi:NADH-quinone oxidoreductase subunit J